MTTLILHPLGYSDITLDTHSVQTSTTGFYAPADSIDLSVDRRIEIIYSETDFGGSAIESKSRLAPFLFTAFIFADDRQTMLQRAHQLKQAIAAGGTVEYQPDGASIATFYLYEASAPPGLSNIPTNIWDMQNADHDRQVIAFDVVLQTKPMGRSELFEFIAPSRTTLENTYESSYSANYFDLTGLKGDSPAIVQTRITGDNEYSRFYICSRSNVLSTFTNLKQIYEAEDGTYTNWTLQADATRSNGQYIRITNPSPNQWFQLKLDISNESDHRGLIAVMPIIRATSSNFQVKVSYEVGDFEVDPEVFSGNTKYAPEVLSKWHILYAGEYNFPMVGVSDAVNIQPKLVINVRLTSGTGVFEIDNVALLFSDESVMQVDVDLDRSYGVDTSYYLFLSTNDDNQRIAHIIDDSYNTNKVAARTFGSLFLEAIDDTRFFFLFERIDTESNLHVPADTITLDTTVMYRTIYPFD